jgi:hypothetical protein
MMKHLALLLALLAAPASAQSTSVPTAQINTAVTDANALASQAATIGTNAKSVGTTATSVSANATNIAKTATLANSITLANTVTTQAATINSLVTTITNQSATISSQANSLSSTMLAWLHGAPPTGPLPQPQLVQLVAWPVNLPGMTTQGNYAVAGNNFKTTLPNAVLAGNALLIPASWPNSSAAPTISDNVNGTWPAVIGTVSGGSGKLNSGFFLLPNAKAGVTTITVTFSGTVIPFQWNIIELSNVTGSNGSVGTANVAGPSLATGSFTPGNNNAAGGNLIVSYFANSITSATTGPNPWTAGTGQTLLEADMTGYFQGASSQPAYSHATQSLLQTTSAAINPAIAATGDTSSTYNCLAIALTVGTAGSNPSTSGLRVVKVINQSIYNASATTLKMQIPWTGNLRFVGVLTGQSVTWGSITNSDGYTWVNKAPGSPNDVWAYAQNAVANTNATITFGPVTWDSYPNHSFTFLDIANAPAAAYDNFTSAVGSGFGITGVPAITPNASSGLTIAAVALYTGPGTGVTAPTGAIFDFITYPQETDADNYDNADLFAHYYFSSNAAQSFSWTINAGQGATQSTFGYYAITFANAAVSSGVTFVAIDGESMGSNTNPTSMSHSYYARSGYSNAASGSFSSNYTNGWDSPNFFPVGPFEEDVNNISGTANWITTWSQLGWNTAFNVDNNNTVDLTNMRVNGIYLLPNAQGANGGTLTNLGGIGAETVGWESYDEPGTYANATSAITGTPNTTQAGRFWWAVAATSFLQYPSTTITGIPGISGSSTGAQAINALLYTPVTKPSGGTVTFGAYASDTYWFNGAATNYGLAQTYYDSNLSNTGLARNGAFYGDWVTWQRTGTSGNVPIFMTVETGNPSTTGLTGTTTTQPTELTWGAFSAIIGGVRGLIYFDHSFAAPGTSNNNMYQSYYSTAGNYAVGYSMYAAVAATDALISALAPIINSPSAVGYVTATSPIATVPSTTFAGLNTSAQPTAYTGTTTGSNTTDMFGPYYVVKYFAGTPYTKSVANVPPYSTGYSTTFSDGYYIIATTRNSETVTNYSVTFTINDNSSPTGITVVGENRTRTLTHGSGNSYTFTDTFTKASDVHIYQVNG